MRLLLVTEKHEARGGGLTTAVQQLTRHMALAGHEVTVLCTGDDPLAAPDGATLVRQVPTRAGARWGWSPGLFPIIDKLVRAGELDRVHVHGVWQAAQWYAARRARAAGVPVMLSCHGMLEPYHWRDRGRQQYVMKRAYWTAMAYPAFRHAALIHAITPAEARNLRQLFPEHEVEIIPNAVDLEEVDRGVAEAARNGPIVREPVIGFMGRFHHKKGLDLLIEAFSQADVPPAWRLRIAGPPGTRDYMTRLERAVARSPRTDRIEIVGPVFGSAKWRFLSSVSVVAVPSRSEAIGLVNLEAAACGTPTITTPATGLVDWDGNGGIVVPPDAGAIRGALEQVSQETAPERAERSRACRTLVEQRYSWRAVSDQWNAAYQRVGARHPELVPR